MGSVQDTVNYGYGDDHWGDLLTSYDGQTITYDGIGNPTSYYNGTRWTFAWERGRQLVSTSNGTTTWTNTYNPDGMRIRRTDGTNTYTYYYNGTVLKYLDYNGTKLYFSVDATGKAVEVSYGPSSTYYYYVRNLQGDVIALLDKTGKPVVEYTYDAWGNVLSITGSLASTLGVQNPFRYRNYVYDQETGLYYLQSRYYDPKVGRFVNADVLVATGQGLLGNNMFSYCRNNPVCRVDLSGTADTIAYNDGELLSNDELDCRANGGGGSIYNQSFKNYQSSSSRNPVLNNSGRGHGGNAKSSSLGVATGTVIYRYGYTGPSKLVPTENDVQTNTGLSFSTKPRSGAAVTTIEEVNSTGTLYAVQDGKYHVSVYPIGGSVYDWYLAGANSIWTQSLIGVVAMS